MLLPILLQVLGGLLSLTLAGGVLERGSGSADTVATAPFSPDGPSPGEQPDSRDPSPEPSDETEEVPPASSSDAGSVPASVKLSEGPRSETSRLAVGSRAAPPGQKASPLGAGQRRERLAALPPRVASTPVGGSLSPLSPRGPPVA